MSGHGTFGTLDWYKNIHVNSWIIRSHKAKGLAFFKCTNHVLQTMVYDFYNFSFSAFSTGWNQRDLYNIILNGPVCIAFRNNKSKTAGMCGKYTGEVRTGALRIFAFCGHLNFALCHQCIQHFLQFMALRFRHVHQDCDFFCLHWHIQIIADQFIYNLFSLF